MSKNNTYIDVPRKRIRKKIENYDVDSNKLKEYLYDCFINREVNYETVCYYPDCIPTVKSEYFEYDMFKFLLFFPHYNNDYIVNITSTDLVL